MNRKSVARLVERVANPQPGDFFCAAPFYHLYNDNAGRWRLCCRAHPFDHTVGDTTPLAHLNHPLMRRIRKEMLSGRLDVTKRYCRKCLAMEKAGMLSVRQQTNRKLVSQARPVEHPVFRAAARVARRFDGRLPLKERCLELKLRIFGNTCNLRCYMCAPVNSTARIAELEKIRGGHWLRKMTVPDRHDLFSSEKAYARFVEDTIRLLPYVKKIRITGGEPFLLEKHYDFLERVVAGGHAPHITLTYDSNLTAFKLGARRVTDYLAAFKKVTLFVSIDNIGPKNDYIRYGSKFDALVENIRLAKAMPNMEIAVNCSTGMLNAGDVHEIAAFFESLDLGTGFGTCVITKPVFLQARHLPDPLKEEYLARLRRSPYRRDFEALERMLMQPRSEEEFQTFLEYIRDLDAKRGTDFLKLWPEFAPYARRADGAAQSGGPGQSEPAPRPVQ